MSLARAAIGRTRKPSQTLGFAKKELEDIIRQPRLLLMLVLGPFLVLLAFGLGYKRNPDPYKTLFVIPAGSPIAAQVDKYASDLGRYVRYEGSTQDAAAARARLDRGDIDVVVEFPGDPLTTVLKGQQAPITVSHNRLDPIEQTAIDFAARLAVDEINSEILATIVTQGQEAARPLGGVLDAASGATQALDSAVSRADRTAAAQAVQDLSAQITQLRTLLQQTTGIAGQLAAEAPAALADPLSTATDSLTQLDGQVTQLQATLASADPAAVAQRVADVESTLQTVHQNFDALTTVEAKVLVRPFSVQVRAPAPGSNTITDFYAPAAVVLLVQQFGVAFGALTFVRERTVGTVELYRAAPLSPGPLLVGKYFGYLLVGGAVAAILVELVVAALGVPFHGRIIDGVIVLGLVLLASVGLGFVISLVSRNDTQAVQYAMLVLLASLFFSGFFLATAQLVYPAHIISWLLPATFGISLLRDVMLRGVTLEPGPLAGLVAYAAVVVALSYVGARRLLKPA